MKQDGYRYIRRYWRGNNRENYALFEVQGGKARRVGTARSEEDYKRFLFATVSGTPAQVTAQWDALAKEPS